MIGATFGIAGEAGEVADAIKKAMFHQHEMGKRSIALELGDLLWYVTLMANTLGFSLSEIMGMNMEKLQARYPDGFDPERSRNRELEG